MTWTEKHSFQSMQTRYRNNRAEFDKVIVEIASKLKLHPGGRGQYARRYAMVSDDVEDITENDDDGTGEDFGHHPDTPISRSPDSQKLGHQVRDFDRSALKEEEEESEKEEKEIPNEDSDHNGPLAVETMGR
jgi:hypothetical protein